MSTSTTRSRTLRMSAHWRVVFSAVTAFMAAGLLWNLLAWAHGDLEWTATTKVVLPVLAVVVAAMIVGVVALWSSRVWVDHDRNELHWSTLIGTAVLPLDPPTTIRIRHQPAAPGNTVMGKWLVRISPPDRPSTTLSTPAMPSIEALVDILHPAYVRNPDLPEDEYTREVLGTPGQRVLPPRAGGR